MEEQYYESRHTGDRVDKAIAKIPKTDNPVVPSLIVVNSSGENSTYKPVSEIIPDVVVDEDLSDTSRNPVQNMAITKALSEKLTAPHTGDISGLYLSKSGEGTVWSHLPVGETGESAYDIWIDNGNYGSELVFSQWIIGPQGPQGEQGIQGEHGLDVTSGAGLPTTQPPQGTTYINATTGDVYRRYNNIWQLIGNIKGATGSIGPAGPQGKTGPIGQTGATGPQGPRGIGVNILGTLTSTSQLPDPATVGKDSAYIIPADGVNHLWVIEGTDNLVWTDFGTAGLGEKGDKGDAGVGIDTMTNLDLTYGNTTVNYDTVNGMTINGQARFTYDGGTTKDVPMDIEVPVVAGDGITIDKKSTEEKVEVKLDTAFTDGKYAGKLTQPYVIYLNDGEGKIFPAPYNYQPYHDAVVCYDGIGCLRTNDPNGEDGRLCVNKKYANAHYLAKQEGIVGQTRVYTVRRDMNESYQETAYVDSNYTEWSVALRALGGVLRVGTPVGVNDATTKAYVDGLHHYSHHIVISDGTSEIFITLAIKNYPNAVTTLDGVTELVGALTEGGMQPIMATGVVDGHNVHAVLVQADQKLYANFYDSTKGILTDKVQVLFNDTVTVHDMVV